MQKGSIVLIDDSKAELRLLQEAFLDVNYPHDLMTFTNGESAFAYISKAASKIFIILCDIQMPGMTGPNLLEKINAVPELKLEAIPFLFFSNSAEQKDIIHAYELAAQGYFQKPLSVPHMTDLFNRIIDYWSASYIPHGRHHRPF